MARSKEYVDAVHTLIDLSHALSRLESENASLRGAADGLCNDNAKLRELVEDMLDCIQIRAAFSRPPTDEMYEMFYKRARELGVDE